MNDDYSNIALIYESLKHMRSVEEIAKKHNVSADVVKDALKKGQKVEMEHATDVYTAKTIASHHLWEFIKYYDKLEKMEKELDRSKNK